MKKIILSILLMSIIFLTGCIQERALLEIPSPDTKYKVSKVWVAEYTLIGGEYSAIGLVNPYAKDGIFYSNQTATAYSSIYPLQLQETTEVGFKVYDSGFDEVVLQIKNASGLVVAAVPMLKRINVTFYLSQESVSVPITNAYVVGDFNDWGKSQDFIDNPDRYKFSLNDNGVWEVTISLFPNKTYEYKFLINPTSLGSDGPVGGVWIQDPSHLDTASESPDANSVITVEW